MFCNFAVKCGKKQYFISTMLVTKYFNLRIFQFGYYANIVVSKVMLVVNSAQTVIK